jgi:hypothetical protein
MMTSIVNADSLLAVDVGAAMTRAMLFDVVDGRYRYLAGGESPSTHVAPFFDVREGVHTAIEQIQSITDRVLIGADEQLIIPCQPDGTGIDTFTATISIEPALNILVMGLLDDVSLESAKNLAQTTYSRIVGSISLNDHLDTQERINKIVRIKPDLVIAAGGAEAGASQSVLKLIEAVGLAAFLLPKENRPEILYVGNSELWEEVKVSLENITSISFSANVRPSLEDEHLEASRMQLARVFKKICAARTPGVTPLDIWANGGLLPTSTAFGRVIQFLSKAHRNKKGVLGLDMSSHALTVAGARDGNLLLSVYPEYGLNGGTDDLNNHGNIDDIMRWLTSEKTADQVRDYLVNRSFYPGTIPVTLDELDLELAVLRVLLRKAIKAYAKRWPDTLQIGGETLIAPVEPILITGDLLSKLQDPAICALMILDGLQPTGVTTLIEDRNRIAAALGSAAALNPLLTVQVLDTSSFLHLGTVISPVGRARPGTPILKLKMTYPSGHESVLEVKQGALETLPLPSGQSANIQLQPLHRFDVGMGAPGRGGGLKVTGGALGVIVDARGRPFQYPTDLNRRRELVKKWLWTLGGR